MPASKLAVLSVRIDDRWCLPAGYCATVGQVQTPQVVERPGTNTDSVHHLGRGITAAPADAHFTERTYQYALPDRHLDFEARNDRRDAKVSDEVAKARHALDVHRTQRYGKGDPQPPWMRIEAAQMKTERQTIQLDALRLHVRARGGVLGGEEQRIQGLILGHRRRRGGDKRNSAAGDGVVGRMLKWYNVPRTNTAFRQRRGPGPASRDGAGAEACVVSRYGCRQDSPALDRRSSAAHRRPLSR